MRNIQSNNIIQTLCLTNNISNLYKNTLLQKIFIVSIILIVFWHGIWDSVPRADQISYLHQISQFHSLLGIIKNSFAWNRVIGGDELLFRPILYMQLGTFYYFFGYNFVLWQIGSLVLHISVVLAVYSLLLKSKLRETLYPLLLSLLLGVGLTSSELVFWHHIGGYLLFCLFGVLSITYLINFFETKNNKHLLISLILSICSEFTYELGFILNVFIGFLFLHRYLFFPKTLKHNENLKISIIYMMAALLYPLFSIYNLFSMGLLHVINSFPTPSRESSSVFNYATKQIDFWFKCLLLPTKIHVLAIQRGYIDRIGVPHDNLTLYYINKYAYKILLYSLVLKLSFSRNIIASFKNYNFLCSCAASMLFLFVYSLIIAYGRTAQRGMDYTLICNIYYSYISYTIAIVGIALYSYNYKIVNADNINFRNKYRLSALKHLFNISAIIGLTVIISLNGCAVFELGKNFRFEYSASRYEVINLIKTWVKSQKINSKEYFIVKNCVGNDYLEWFEGNHIRKNSQWEPPFNLADALWPEKSFMLNKKALKNNKNYSIKKIDCNLGSVDI